MTNVTMASGAVIFGDVCGSEKSSQIPCQLLESWRRVVHGASCGLSWLFAQVCDEPHPLLVKEMIQHCVDANIDEAYKVGLLFLP